MQFYHLTFMVRDLEKSMAFYQELAELHVVRRFRAGDGEIAFLANGEGETMIELVCMPGGTPFEGKGMTVCFLCDDVSAVLAMAMAMGLHPSDLRNPDPQSLYFYVYDPNGVSVEFRQKM